MKNTDIDKHKSFGYGIGFDMKGTFGFPAIEFDKNIIIFGVEMSSPPHIDNKKKDILIYVKRPKQGLEHTLPAESFFQFILQSIIKIFAL